MDGLDGLDPTYKFLVQLEHLAVLKNAFSNCFTNSLARCVFVAMVPVGNRNG